MSKRYDATKKWLVATWPRDWQAVVGVEAETVEDANADVSTDSSAVDKALRIKTRNGTYIQHWEFQSGPDTTITHRTYLGSALLTNAYELPVESFVVIYSKKAELAAINGLHELIVAGATAPYLQFLYKVIRVWELQIQKILTGPIGILPNAPLCNVDKKDLPSVIDKMRSRLDREVAQTVAGDLWTATQVLMGIRYKLRRFTTCSRGSSGWKNP